MADKRSLPSVTLRRATSDDTELILSWRREPSVRRFQPLRQLSVNELRRLLAERAARPLDGTLDGEIQWAIETAEGPVGWVTFGVTSREHGTGVIGYTVGEHFRDRGYATAAVRAAIAIALDPERLDLWRVEAVAAVDNTASRRVLERAGLHFEGIARDYLLIAGKRHDHARYAILRSDWQPDEGERRDS